MPSDAKAFIPSLNPFKAPEFCSSLSLISSSSSISRPTCTSSDWDCIVLIFKNSDWNSCNAFISFSISNSFFKVLIIFCNCSSSSFLKAIFSLINFLSLSDIPNCLSSSLACNIFLSTKADFFSRSVINISSSNVFCFIPIERLSLIWCMALPISLLCSFNLWFLSSCKINSWALITFISDALFLSFSDIKFIFLLSKSDIDWFNSFRDIEPTSSSPLNSLNLWIKKPIAEAKTVIEPKIIFLLVTKLNFVIAKVRALILVTMP